MRGAAYTASEDSALLRSVLIGYSGRTCLEIGAGNGGSLVELSGGFRLVAGTDLTRPEMSDWKEAGANYVLADLTTCFRPGTLDLVAFNPPYLRDGWTGDRAVEGGDDLEVPKAFLREALRVVRKEGKVVFILNQDADAEHFESICAERGFGMKKVASKHLFFEELAVYEAVSE